jgi:hypothetical protein
VGAMCTARSASASPASRTVASGCPVQGLTCWYTPSELADKRCAPMRNSTPDRSTSSVESVIETSICGPAKPRRDILPNPTGSTCPRHRDVYLLMLPVWMRAWRNPSCGSSTSTVHVPQEQEAR